MANPPLRRYGDAIRKWLPVALWASVIFYFSTERFSAPQTSSILEPLLNWFFPGISGDSVAAVHFALRKLGHISEYVLLAVLLLRALRERVTSTDSRYAGLALALVLLYAVSDELHQSFIPSRTASVGDVLIDLFGGICGVLWMLTRRERNLDR